MPTIESYKRKNGKTYYRFQFYVGIDSTTGKEVQSKRSGFPTRAAAKKALTEIQYKIERDGVDWDKRRLETFNDVYELWLEQYKNQVRPSTYKQVQSMFKHNIIPAFGRYRIQKISVMMCQDVVNEWFGKFVTWGKMATYTSTIFNFAIKLDLIEKNPLDRIERPKKLAAIKDAESEDLKFYTRSELKTFLECAKNDHDKRVHTFFRLLAFSGLRKGEALALTWKDIDFKTGVLSVVKTLSDSSDGIILQPTKNSESRNIPLDKITLDILAGWQKEQRKELRIMNLKPTPKQFVFNNKFNNHVTPSKTGKWVKRVTSRNNLKAIRTHDFRHTHCSLLLESGASLLETAERLGHKDIEMVTKVYAHISKDAKKTLTEKFENYMSF